MVCAFEQRRSVRKAINWPVSIWHPKAARFFNGLSINISQNGTLLELSLNVPLREGQDLEINFPRTEALAKDKGSFSRIKNARVVRVDRSDSLSNAKVKVGLAFYEQPEPYASPE